MDIILTPPLAFLIYIPLVLIIFWIGKGLAGPEKPGSPLKRSLYGSGELAPTQIAAPGYRPCWPPVRWIGPWCPIWWGWASPWWRCCWVETSGQIRYS